MNKQECEQKARVLVGRSIDSVVYYGIDYLGGLFHFFDDPRFDSVDCGLELNLAGTNVSQ
jgi:hypothetical protein